jgi:cytochrome P450
MSDLPAPSALDDLLVSPDLRLDPYPLYRRLRSEAPICWSERWQAWVLSRYDDVAASLKDKENLSNENRQGLLFNSLSEPQRQDLTPLRHYFAQKDVIGSDPPDHTRMRALVQKAFTPRTVAGLGARIRQLAQDLLAAQTGPFDFVAEIAHPLPIILIAEILGAPPADRPLFKRWSSDILGFQGSGTTQYDLAMVSQRSLMEMFEYMSKLIDERRAAPQDDIISTLALAEEAGRGFSRDELLATCNTILTAGHETTTNLLGSLVYQLVITPGAWAQVRNQPELIPTATEEALRFEAPKQRNFRRVKRTHVFRGTEFRENQMVFQLIGSANRDETHFSQPDVFDPARSPNDHLSFGSGIHFCLGAPLARLEAQIVLETLFRAGTRAELLAPITWQERQQFRGPGELRIALT